MITPDIQNPTFRQAVEAIDSGDITELKTLLDTHPELITERLNYPDGGYFRDPYLLWFVADNPIRAGKLAENIVEITRLLIKHVKENDTNNAQQQLDYTLALVESGHIPSKCGVQIEMIDLLIDSGAAINGIMGAAANGNMEAARHLIGRGAKLTLAGAVCLDQMEEVKSLITTASPGEKLTALTAAAFYGKTGMIEYLLSAGAKPNGYPAEDSGFHRHGTPLHQAVSSASLQAVKLLVKAGADLNAKDKVYNGTPLDWADYLQRDDEIDDAAKRDLALIADYLQR